jgi:RNA polymerase subunit RPABC4/transcription elongation factor Spt4
MTAGGHKDIFLSCFKCGRIVRSSDKECPRCGLQFGPGTLFECPFCCGLVWRNATSCQTCGIDLTQFSEGVERASRGFDMDAFVDNIISSELEQMKATVRRVSCPGCGLMIRGDETKCPRCELSLGEASVECPVCGDKIPISATTCPNCHAVLVIQAPVLESCSVPSEATSRNEVAPTAAKKTAVPRKKAAPKKPRARKQKAAKPPV